MKILQNKWNRFFIVCFIWLAIVFVVMGVYFAVRPHKSTYEGGFFQCLSFSQPGWYECDQESYLFNVVTDRYLAVLLTLIVSPYLFFLMFAFYPEQSGVPWYQVVLLFVSMPYVFIPVMYLVLHRLNLYLQRKLESRLSGTNEKGLTNISK